MKPCILSLLIPVAFAQVGTPASIGHGDKLFAQGCAVGYCHGVAGTAARSPRLRGRSFEREYLVRVIRDGIPNTAMLAWGDRLTDDDIASLADYIVSLANVPVEAGSTTAVPEAPARIMEKAADVPPEHHKGKQLFFDLTREARCASCHRLEGVGQAVGPDLTKAGSLKTTDGPQVLKYGRPRRVVTVAMKDGERFPAVAASKNRYFDLSAMPPVLRSVGAADLQGVQRQTNWRHAAAVRAYSAEEMQAIWDYVRWLAARK